MLNHQSHRSSYLFVRGEDYVVIGLCRGQQLLPASPPPWPLRPVIDQDYIRRLSLLLTPHIFCRMRMIKHNLPPACTIRCRRRRPPSAWPATTTAPSTASMSSVSLSSVVVLHVAAVEEEGEEPRFSGKEGTPKI